MSWRQGDKRLADVLPPAERLPILLAKAARHNAKANQLLADVMAEVADRSRQQAGEAQRAARRERLAAAGVFSTPKR